MLRLIRAPRVVSLLVLSCVAGPAAEAASTPVRARRGMVVSQEAVASGVGDQVLRDGGNAVDAAVATAFALAVTHPTAGNIGGGGFIVYRAGGGRAASPTTSARRRRPRRRRRCG